ATPTTHIYTLSLHDALPMTLGFRDVRLEDKNERSLSLSRLSTMNENTTPSWDREVDLLVLGTGAAGLSAALTGTAEGLSVLPLEKTDFTGGTTAYSAGTCWVPNNHFQKEDGVDESREKVERYLDAVVGDKADKKLRMAYVDNGPDML